MNNPRPDIRQDIAAKFIEALDSGIVPWQRPWHLVKGGGSLPRNYVSKKTYRGANLWYLSMLQGSKGYSSSEWATFKQISEAKGFVKKGERGTAIMWWNWLEVESKTPSEEIIKKTVPVVKSFVVFNRDQTSLPALPAEQEASEEFSPIESAEQIVRNMQNAPTVHFSRQNQACYYPGNDTVSMPSKKQFKTPEYMYHTLFHELAHSTGHKDRLNRLTGNHYRFGNESYSKEELVAETAAAYLVAECNFVDNVFDNSRAYFQNWGTALKKDPKIIIDAMSAANKAADYILGR